MPSDSLRAGRFGADRRAASLPVSPHSRFGAASAPARALVVGAVLAAITLAVVAGSHAHKPFGLPTPAVAAVLVAGSIGSVELGRVLRGRITIVEPPDKTLSLWAFASAASLPSIWLLAVVPLVYVHAYWRGLRPPAWRWIGSAAFLVLAGVAAHEAVFQISGGGVFENRPSDCLALLAGIAAFLAVESLLFFAVSRVNDPRQEQWLRATLGGPWFYVTEVAVLCFGALTVAVWSGLPWFGVLLVPAYALVQQAAMFDPLRREAACDDKTGLLRWEPWRARSASRTGELARAGRSWAVVMVDLDHFAAFNAVHGHFAADDVLVQAARAIEGNVRSGDLVCRFGGEEFAVLLADAGEPEARLIAQRLREAIARASRPPVTASIGVAFVSSRGELPANAAQLRQALVAADRALYDAKTAGRDRVVVHLVAA